MADMETGCLRRYQDISRGLWGDKARDRQSRALLEVAFNILKCETAGRF